MAGDRAMTAQARLVSAAGRLAGTARFEQAPTGVLIRITARGLPPGPHGLHLHETGACTPDFGAAGGHVNPDGAMHGLKHPDGPDPGDLPNLIVGGDGRADAELFTTPGVDRRRTAARPARCRRDGDHRARRAGRPRDAADRRRRGTDRLRDRPPVGFAAAGGRPREATPEPAAGRSSRPGLRRSSGGEARREPARKGAAVCGGRPSAPCSRVLSGRSGGSYPAPARACPERLSQCLGRAKPIRIVPQASKCVVTFRSCPDSEDASLSACPQPRFHRVARVHAGRPHPRGRRGGTSVREGGGHGTCKRCTAIRCGSPGSPARC